MSEHTMKLAEMIPVVGVINPDAYNAATTLSGAIDMSLYSQVMVIVNVGDMASTATLDAKVTQATTSGGTYKDVSGAAITQLTQASPDDSNKLAIINVDQTELDMDNGYRYIKVSVTGATAASDYGVVVVGLPKTRPGSLNDLAAVTEIVT